jgi:hypothetical protein
MHACRKDTLDVASLAHPTSPHPGVRFLRADGTLIGTAGGPRLASRDALNVAEPAAERPLTRSPYDFAGRRTGRADRIDANVDVHLDSVPNPARTESNPGGPGRFGPESGQNQFEHRSSARFCPPGPHPRLRPTDASPPTDLPLLEARGLFASHAPLASRAGQSALAGLLIRVRTYLRLRSVD